MGIIIGTVLSAAQKLCLQCSELEEILSIFGYKSQLDDLRRTVSAVNAVLLDAEAKQELSREAQYKLEELKDAVFEADDLLDEFVTLAQQKQLLEAGGSLSKKVCRFFSDNPLGVAYRMSRGVKKIRKKLDAIAYNTQFSFKHDPEPIRRRRPETCSYVDIIGRKDDLEKIVGLMLDSNVQRDVSFLTISVGVLPNPPDDLVKIGKEIVKGCARVPLAIRVVGSLLYGQDKSKWLSLAQIRLANLRESQNDIMPILKLSYHYLESPLKSCFSYCALFPKDYKIRKEKLISLWMAQGYIVPLDEGQSIEDAAEEYISILLRRCFFQDVEKDVYGDIVILKIHDLMQDVAQTVTKLEICATDTLGGILDDKFRHLSVTRNKVARCTLYRSQIRTYLCVGQWKQVVRMEQFFTEALLANCIHLRALDLSHSSIKTLPKSIGELLHLRYLDLSWNKSLEMLPKSITKLCNLQTLKLSNCFRLKELPKDLSRLVKLRTLFTSNCHKMTCFPKGMGKLTGLHRLSDFIIGGEGSYSTTKQWFDELEDLKAMNNLKGSLDIQFKWPGNVIKVDDCRAEGHYLMSKEHLKGLIFHFHHRVVDGDVDTEEARRLMEELQPHSNLKWLEVWWYRGVRMPGWATLLPNLVHILLWHCQELEYLLCLGNLRHLKFLSLKSLSKLEYIKLSSSVFSSTPGSECGQGVSIYPSLERLELFNLQKLKGWRDDLLLLEDNKYMPLCLSKLRIENCPELTCIPLCRKVEDLLLDNFNKRLKVLQTKRNEKIGEVPPSFSILL